MKKSILFISCEEAKLICDKSQYGEATLWEKFKLNLRLSWCRITRAYSSNNRKLSKAIKNSNVDCLKAQERKVLTEVFEQKLSKNNQ